MIDATHWCEISDLYGSARLFANDLKLGTLTEGDEGKRAIELATSDVKRALHPVYRLELLDPLNQPDLRALVGKRAAYHLLREVRGVGEGDDAIQSVLNDYKEHLRQIQLGNLLDSNDDSIHRRFQPTTGAASYPAILEGLE